MGKASRGTVARAAGSVAAAVVLAGSQPVHAAAPETGPTPLGFVSMAACPSADDAARVTDERALTSALQRTDGGTAEERAFVGTMAFVRVASSPSSAVVVCDPASAAAGFAIGPFRGNLMGRSGRDAARPGLRALVAEPNVAGSSLAIGDELELPEVREASTIDVAVHIDEATAHARLGPFPAPPRRLSVSAHPAGASVRVAMQDGTAVERVLSAPAVVRPMLRVSGAGARLVVRGRAHPGSVIVVDHPRPREGAEQAFLAGFDATTTAAESSRFRARTVALDRGQRIATIDAFSLSTGSGASWRCRLTWRGGRIVAARCGSRPATKARRTGPGLLRSATPPKPVPALPAAGGAREAATAAGVHGRAAVIGRVPWLALPESEQDVSLADLTGDGRPELLTAGHAGDHALWASRAAGWQRVALREDAFSDPIRLVDDITGDGLGELWTTPGRGITGHAAWSSETNPSLDLRSRQSLGATDLELPAEEDAFEPAPPIGLPDRTGDGRPELLTGNAVFSSAAFPLGQRTRPTLPWPGAVTASIEAIASATTARGATLTPGPFGGALLTSAGTPPLAVSTSLRRTVTGWATDLEVRAIDGATWGDAPLRSAATVAGIGTIVGGNAATGDVLVRAATSCRGARCAEHLHRLDASGRPIGGALALAEDDEAFAAVLVADGVDADDRAEVVVRDESTGQLRLWRSSDAASTIGALPAVLRGDAPLRTAGPIVPWGAGRPGGLVAFEPMARDGELRALWIEAG